MNAQADQPPRHAGMFLHGPPAEYQAKEVSYKAHQQILIADLIKQMYMSEALLRFLMRSGLRILLIRSTYKVELLSALALTAGGPRKRAGQSHRAAWLQRVI